MKATSLQALKVKINGNVASNETILETLRRAFEHCEVPALALESAGHDLDLQLDRDWSSVTHLTLLLWQRDFMPVRVSDGAHAGAEGH